MHGLALREGEEGARVAGRAGAGVEEVTVEDDQVGQLSGLDRPRLCLEEVDVGRAARVSRSSRSSGSIGSVSRSGCWMRVTATSICASGSAVETVQSLPKASGAPASTSCAA